MPSKGRAAGVYLQGRLCVGLLVCSLGTYAQSFDNVPTSLVRVHGVVVNAVTHTPLSRALVTSVDRRMAVMTDDKGRFEFDVNPAAANPSNSSALQLRGQVQAPYIVARKPGFRAPNLPALLPLDDLAALKAELRLQLMPEGSISGTAVGAADEVPSGLSVELLRRQLQEGISTWNQVQTQQVDARARFHFGGLMPGDYKLVTTEWVEQVGPMSTTASRPVAGYPPQFYSAGSPGTSAAIIHLSGGQNTVADLNLRSAKYFQVELPVASATPVKNIQVQVASENGPGYTLGFNPKSQKVEGMLPDGVYHLTVVEIGDGNALGTNPNIRVGTGNLNVAGRPVQGAAIALAPGTRITLEVREDFTGPDPDAADAAPSPLPEGSILTANTAPPPAAPQEVDAAPPPPPRPVEVFLTHEDLGNQESNMAMPGYFPSLQLDSRTGSLVFESVLPGRYRVRFNARRGYVASATAEGVDLLREPLVVQPGATGPAISIVLRDDTGSIAGTVTGSTGRPMRAFENYVVAFPMGDEDVAQPAFANWQPDGKFTIANVVPGRYLVLAGEGRPVAFEYRNKAAMKAYESQGAVVEVTSRQTAEASLKPLPPETAYGDPGYVDEVEH